MAVAFFVLFAIASVLFLTQKQRNLKLEQQIQDLNADGIVQKARDEGLKILGKADAERIAILEDAKAEAKELVAASKEKIEIMRAGVEKQEQRNLS